jgi:hypothetical protein
MHATLMSYVLWDQSHVVYINAFSCFMHCTSGSSSPNRLRSASEFNPTVVFSMQDTTWRMHNSYATRYAVVYTA